MSYKLTREEFGNICNLIREEKEGMCYLRDQFILDGFYGKGKMVRTRIGPCIHFLMNDIEVNNDLEIGGAMDGESLKFTVILEGELTKKDNITNEITTYRKNDLFIEYQKKESSTFIFHKKNRLKYIGLTCRSRFLEENPYISEILNLKEKESLSVKLLIPKLIDALKSLFSNEECGNKDLERVFLEAKSLDIISMSLQEFLNCSNSLDGIHSDDVDRIRYAKEILDNSISQKITIAQLSKKASINEFKLKKGFKKVFNNTIYGYLQDIRLKKSVELLKTKDFSIKEVASSVGYTNQASFTSAFTKKYGFLPKELIKK